MSERDPGSSFLRGMTIGAIVGAIIAGSSFWARWWSGRRRGSSDVD
jgi:hypothetical protein